jgi:hypothetical protein
MGAIYCVDVPATITKTCSSCREAHLFFLPLGKAAEGKKQYEYTCPKNQKRVRLEHASSDRWTATDSKPPGSVIVREVIGRA